MRYLLLCLACMPAVAQAPDVDQIIAAYSRAPWMKIQDQQGAEYVCIGMQASDQVDRLVTMLAERAKAKCS